MQYYSKTPTELKEHLEELHKRERKKNITSKIFFFLNLAIVLFALAVFQYRVRQAELTKQLARKEFHWARFIMQTHCERVNCKVILKENPNGVDTGLVPALLKFQLAQEEKVVATTLLPLNQQILGEYHYLGAAELTPHNTLFVSVLTADKQEIASFRIYP